ncbi:hypothetical protein V0288_07270 [Pannus brasiliensis CCIBt3594]|uniref:Uncharacterized protein n=1 Tax=Pannus brasiliensis CCIBt3594 TaxID=1427578 RepID=A0AAW9QQA2_9CHRO
MNDPAERFCFATLALGKKYRDLASILAKDIAKYSPGTPFLILTDRVRDFQEETNVLAFSHRQELWCDNDKSFLIEKSLSLFDYCICIDADMRILAPIPQDLRWSPGITAWSCCSLLKHHTRKGITSQALPYLQKIIHRLDLDSEFESIKWIHEYMFVVKKDSGKESEFVRLFEKISRYLEINGIEIGAGSAMGVAARKVGFPVRWSPEERIVFFKDRIVKYKIERERFQPDKKIQACLQLQGELEFPRYSWPQKILTKLNKIKRESARSLRLKINSLSDLEFYYFVQEIESESPLNLSRPFSE